MKIRVKRLLHETREKFEERTPFASALQVSRRISARLTRIISLCSRLGLPISCLHNSFSQQAHLSLSSLSCLFFYNFFFVHYRLTLLSFSLLSFFDFFFTVEHL